MKLVAKRVSAWTPPTTFTSASAAVGAGPVADDREDPLGGLEAGADLGRHPRTPTRMPRNRAGTAGWPGVADLAGLALAAVRRAPERPLVGPAEHVHRRPEPRADAGVGRVAQHPAALAVLDLPADLAAELEVQPLVVDRPRAVGVHVDPVVGRGDHLLERVSPGQQADVGHPHHRQPGRSRRPGRCRRTFEPGERRPSRGRPARRPRCRPARCRPGWAGVPSSS